MRSSVFGGCTPPRALSVKPRRAQTTRSGRGRARPGGGLHAEMRRLRLSVVVIGNATVDLSYDVPRLPAAGETVLARAKRVDAGARA